MQVKRKTDGKVFEVLAIDAQSADGQGARFTPDQIDIIADGPEILDATKVETKDSTSNPN